MNVVLTLKFITSGTLELKRLKTLQGCVVQVDILAGAGIELSVFTIVFAVITHQALFAEGCLNV